MWRVEKGYETICERHGFLSCAKLDCANDWNIICCSLLYLTNEFFLQSSKIDWIRFLTFQFPPCKLPHWFVTTKGISFTALTFMLIFTYRLQHVNSNTRVHQPEHQLNFFSHCRILGNPSRWKDWLLRKGNDSEKFIRGLQKLGYHFIINF